MSDARTPLQRIAIAADRVRQARNEVKEALRGDRSIRLSTELLAIDEELRMTSRKLKALL